MDYNNGRTSTARIGRRKRVLGGLESSRTGLWQEILADENSGWVAYTMQQDRKASASASGIIFAHQNANDMTNSK